MINEPTNIELFKKTSTKKIIISFDEQTISNDKIYQEEMEIVESLCSEEELKFGCCESSAFKIKIRNEFGQLKGKLLNVSMVLNNNIENPFQYGKYKVDICELSGDKQYINITAYDSMFDIINANVVEWYDSLVFPINIKTFRDSFFSYLGIEQETTTLIQDDELIEKTINDDIISGLKVISAVCELNGVLGHINRNGIFTYVSLLKNFEPVNNYSKYISCEYEEFETKPITKLQIRQEEGDIGAVSGVGDNTYIISDNFLVYGKNANDLSRIADKLFEKIRNISYRPFKAEVQGNPCIEVGDLINISTKTQQVTSYLLGRTIKGIQSLKDTFESKGVYEYSEKVNSANNETQQLKGKVNKLSRTVDGTISEIGKIEQNIKDNYSTTAEMNSVITQTAEAINSVVSKKVGYDEVVSAINQTAEEIKIESSKISLEGVITANENFKILEDGSVDIIGGTIGNWYITTGLLVAYNPKVSDNSVILCSDETQYSYAIMAGIIDYGIETEPYAPFMVGFDGSVYASKMYASGGTIGNLIIGINSLYYGTESITSNNEGIYIGTDGFRHVGTNGKVTISEGEIVSDIGTINTINASDTSEQTVRILHFDENNNEYIADGITGNVYIGNVNNVSEIRLLSQSMVALQTGIVRIGANGYTAGVSSNGIQFGSDGNINLSSYGTPSYIQFHFNNSQTGTAMISESARGEIKITGSLITTGTISTNGNIRLDNNNALYIKDAQGTYRSAVTLDSDNVYRYGNGGMSNRIVIGATDYTTSVFVRSQGYIYANAAGIRIGEEDTAGTTSAGTLIHKGYIELSRSAPYIDFHYGEDTGDYTSRIIEEAYGRLFISGALRLGSNLIMPNNVSIQARSTSGTAYALMYLNSSNNVMIGHSSLATYYNSLNKHTFRTGSSNSIAVQINPQPGAKYVDLIVGNSADTDKMMGRIIMYGSGTGFTNIKPLYNGGSDTNINLPATSGTLAIASSDIRLKENVIDSDVNALDVINQIQIRAFNWKETGERQNIGFVADELEEIDGKMVVEGTGGYFEDGTINVKTVDMFYLMGYLCKGEQELYYEIMRLKKELDEIKRAI